MAVVLILGFVEHMSWNTSAVTTFYDKGNDRCDRRYVSAMKPLLHFVFHDCCSCLTLVRQEQQSWKEMMYKIYENNWHMHFWAESLYAISNCVLLLVQWAPLAFPSTSPISMVGWLILPQQQWICFTDLYSSNCFLAFSYVIF